MHLEVVVLRLGCNSGEALPSLIAAEACLDDPLDQGRALRHSRRSAWVHGTYSVHSTGLSLRRRRRRRWRRVWRRWQRWRRRWRRWPEERRLPPHPPQRRVCTRHEGGGRRKQEHRQHRAREEGAPRSAESLLTRRCAGELVQHVSALLHEVNRLRHGRVRSVRPRVLTQRCSTDAGTHRRRRGYLARAPRSLVKRRGI